MTRGKPFEQGNKKAKGGARPNAGRKPDWFRERMRQIASSKESIKFIEDCVNGEPVDEFIVPQTGEAVPVRPKAETRLKAWAQAADRGFGRAQENIEVTSGGLTLFDWLRGESLTGDGQ